MKNPAATFLAAALIALPLTLHADSVEYDFDALSDGFLPKRDQWQVGINVCYPQVGPGEGAKTAQVAFVKGGAGGVMRPIGREPFQPVPRSGWIELDVQWTGPAEKERSVVEGLTVESEFAGKPDLSILAPRVGIFSAFSEARKEQVNQILLVVYRGGKEVFARAPLPDTIQVGGWLRVRLEIDFSANGGNGSGKVLIKNLAQPDEDFVETGIKAVDLNITELRGKAADPANWNAWFLRMVNSEGNGNTSMPVSRLSAGTN